MKLLLGKKSLYGEGDTLKRPFEQRDSTNQMNMAKTRLAHRSLSSPQEAAVVVVVIVVTVVTVWGD
jgi:hypothetical protein